MEGDGRAREREGGHLLALPAERPCWDRPVRALTRELCQAAEQEQLLCRDHIESLSSLGLLCDSEAVLSSEEQSSKLLELRLPCGWPWTSYYGGALHGFEHSCAAFYFSFVADFAIGFPCSCSES